MQITYIIFFLLAIMSARCQVTSMPVGNKEIPEAVDIPYNPALGQHFRSPAISISAVIPYGLTQVQDNQAVIVIPVAGNVICAGMRRLHLNKWTEGNMVLSVSRSILPGFDAGILIMNEYNRAGSKNTQAGITGGIGVVFRVSDQVTASAGFRHATAFSLNPGVLFHSSLSISPSRKVVIGGWMENMSDQHTALSLALNYCLAPNLQIRCTTEPEKYAWNFSALILFKNVVVSIGVKKNDVPGLTSCAVFQFQSINYSSLQGEGN